jgi:hypothetical protein
MFHVERARDVSRGTWACARGGRAESGRSGPNPSSAEGMRKDRECFTWNGAVERHLGRGDGSGETSGVSAGRGARGMFHVEPPHLNIRQAGGASTDHGVDVRRAGRFEDGWQDRLRCAQRSDGPTRNGCLQGRRETDPVRLAAQPAKRRPRKPASLRQARGRERFHMEWTRVAPPARNGSPSAKATWNLPPGPANPHPRRTPAAVDCGCSSPSRPAPGADLRLATS